MMAIRNLKLCYCDFSVDDIIINPLVIEENF